MNNKDFQKELAQRLSLTQKEIANYLADFTACMAECFTKGESITFSKLGTLSPRKKVARTTTLPNSQEKITVPEKTVLTFKTAVSYKEKLNQINHE
ncbi:MAG: HU family DNA-binding protein [Paludibacteraceae bacterium]|jgi:nucleoid DNA-binding protein|nr:HU family DNA-binding protein [Paludibacteraceae bacterium]